MENLDPGISGAGVFENFRIAIEPGDLVEIVCGRVSFVHHLRRGVVARKDRRERCRCIRIVCGGSRSEEMKREQSGGCETG